MKLGKVGWCWLNPVEPRVESACFQRLKQKYEKPLLSVAFICSFRHYMKVETQHHQAGTDTRSPLNLEEIDPRCRGCQGDASSPHRVVMYRT
jgi:hypothetical protein